MPRFFVALLLALSVSHTHAFENSATPTSDRAMAAEDEARPGAALALFSQVSRKDPTARAAGLREMAQIARATGNLMLERVYLAELRLGSLTNPSGSAVSFNIARNHVATGSFTEAVRLLSGRQRTAGGDRRDALALLGQAYLGLREVERARQVFGGLLDSTPDTSRPDDAALVAARELDRMDTGPDGRLAPLAENEHLRRANIYQAERDVRSARAHLEAVLALYPEGANTADAAMRIGRLYSIEGDHPEAARWFERVMEQYPSSPAARDALLYVGGSYSRLGRRREALARYESFIDKYPTEERIDRAYLNIVDLDRDEGADSDALKQCGKAEAALRGKPAEALAVFAAARIHIAREDWPKALEALDRSLALPDLGGGARPGSATRAEIAFLRGLVFEQLKQFDSAVETYLSIADGRDEYYGWRATERLRALARDQVSEENIVTRVQQLTGMLNARDNDQRRRAAQALLRVATSDEARGKAMDALRTAIRSLPAYRLPIEKADTQGRTADAADTLAALEPVWRKIPADFPIDLIPRDTLLKLYPVAFRAEVLRSAAARGVDPRLVLAIMRQESRFRPDARSIVAARGLMQFIGPTARHVADQLGRERFAREDLYDPSTSVLFGTHYLAGLFEIFPGRTEAVVAAYNGGDDNMRRWLARARSAQPERYVSEIMFAQTKEYVERVMANLRMYTYLYDERLGPK
jgi:soluble lytic murein transglycosylase-like protein